MDHPSIIAAIRDLKRRIEYGLIQQGEELLSVQDISDRYDISITAAKLVRWRLHETGLITGWGIVK